MKLKLFLLSVVAALMVGCSDAPDESGRIDVDLIKTLSRDGSVSTYGMTDFHVYERDTVEGSQFVEFDYTELIGSRWPDISTTFCFQDGCLWEPVTTSTPAQGPARAYLVWLAYCKFSKTGGDKEFYVRKKFTYNESEHTMQIGRYTFKVEEFTDKSLKMYKIGEVYHGTTDFKLELCAYWKYTYDFKISEPVRFDGENVMAFDSNAECYRYWVKQYRDKYGRYLNMDEYYGGTAFLENPIMDMDEVEKWIDEFEKSEN